MEDSSKDFREEAAFLLVIITREQKFSSGIGRSRVWAGSEEEGDRMVLERVIGSWR